MITKAAGKPNALSDAARYMNTKYGCGPVQFAGKDEALYERHLLFDNSVQLAAATARDRFEALARSVRDILSQRWLLTEETYEQQNPKRLYYLSMEFLIGRSLLNNVTNLLLAPIADQVIEDKKLDLLEILEQEPDAGLGNGGLGRLAACFIESAATMQLPAMGYGLRYEYGIFRQSIQNGWQHETPDNWLRFPDPMGGRSPERKGGSQARMLFRTQRRQPASRAGASIDAGRYSVRPSRNRVWREHN
jgi:starch phosphorylase